MLQLYGVADGLEIVSNLTWNNFSMQVLYLKIKVAFGFLFVVV